MSGPALPSPSLVLAVVLAVPALAVATRLVFCEPPGLGPLRGSTKLSAANATFAAFEGVPYARPPVGQLRFRPAQPMPPFVSILDCRHPRSPCPYLNDKRMVVGSEDCLYLNVYTPLADDDLALPVVVVLPGEDWTRGYAGRWQPHRLVDRRLVVVTVQSRLGALGFLSTGDAAAPGNLGLKDERLALQWVSRHIAAFGGDPRRVTLVGVGAGAAAAMLHTLSQQQQQRQGAAVLFQRAIAVSGSALGPRALTDAVPATRRLAEAVGCDCPIPVHTNSAANNATANATTANTATAAINATDSAANVTTTTTTPAPPATRPANLTEILDCLRTRSAADIVYGTARLQGWAGLPPSPFGPTVERSGNETFLSDTPQRLWQAAEGGNASVPLLLGLTSSEGLQDLKASGVVSLPGVLNYLDAEWARLAPALLAFNDTPAAERTEAAAMLRRRYLAEAPLANDTDGLLWLYGDRHVVMPALRAATLHARVAPVYLYRFAWGADNGYTGLAGPAGGADASMVLMNPTPDEAERAPARRAIVRDVLDLWASFIVGGTPAVGNATLARVGPRDAEGDAGLPFVELLQPGVQRLAAWPVRDALAFWDGLPLAENQRPPSPDPTVSPQPPNPQRGAKSEAWRQPALPALVLVGVVRALWGLH